MKSILLHTAACDNGLNRRDAGETVGVGTKPDQVAATFAASLVAIGAAVDASPAKSKSSSSPTASLLEAATPPIQPDHTSDEAE